MDKGKLGLKPFAKHTAWYFYAMKIHFHLQLSWCKSHKWLWQHYPFTQRICLWGHPRLCISHSSKGLQQEPRKIYSQLVTPGNICNLFIQFNRFLLPCLLPLPSAFKTRNTTDIFIAMKISDLSYISPLKRKQSPQACCLSITSSCRCYTAPADSPTPK